MIFRITFLLLILSNSVYSQDYFGTRSLVLMAERSDLIVLGVIKSIEEVEGKKGKIYEMPLKKGLLEIQPTCNNKIEEKNINYYYEDILTGCGNMPVKVQNFVGDTVLMFLEKNQNGYYQNSIMRYRAKELSMMLKELQKIKHQGGIEQEENLKEWIIKSIEEEKKHKNIGILDLYKEKHLRRYLEVEELELTYSKSQRERLYKVLASSEELDMSDEKILLLLKGVSDKEYMMILTKYLKKMLLGNDYYAENLMNLMTISLDDRSDLKKLLEDYKEVKGTYFKRRKMKERILKKFVKKI